LFSTPGLPCQGRIPRVNPNTLHLAIDIKGQGMLAQVFGETQIKGITWIRLVLKSFKILTRQLDFGSLICKIFFI
jgi:hypothetical protein